MTDLDVAEAARALGVTERTIRRWLKDGRLAGFKVGGRIRIPERAVREVASPYGSAEGEGPARDGGGGPRAAPAGAAGRRAAGAPPLQSALGVCAGPHPSIAPGAARRDQDRRRSPGPEGLRHRSPGPLAARGRFDRPR